MASSRYITDILETMEMQKYSGAPTPIMSVRSGDPAADGNVGGRRAPTLSESGWHCSVF